MFFIHHFTVHLLQKTGYITLQLILDKKEKTNFDNSIQAVRQLFEVAVKIDEDLGN